MTASNYTLCKQYAGSVPVNAGAPVLCSPTTVTFRYVIIQSSITSDDALCLVEVRVYIGKLEENQFFCINIFQEFLLECTDSDAHNRSEQKTH